MQKFKSIIAPALLAAVAVSGAGIATAAPAAAAEEPNVGPYKCSFSLPLLEEKDPLLLAAVMCKGPLGKPGEQPAPGGDTGDQGPGKSEDAPGQNKGGGLPI